jgi:NADH-quinone oxidoreductase subunit C
MTDSTDPKRQMPDTPDPQPKATADGSAPIADPPGLVDALAQPTDPTAGGSQTEPTATQEVAEPIKTQVADVELANVEAMVERLDAEGTKASDSWGRAAYIHDDVERHPAVRVIREHLPGTILEIVRFRDETTIHVRREDLRAVCVLLRDEPRVRFNFLSDLTAVDMLRLRQNPRFDVVVQLYSLSNRIRLRLKAGCNDGESVPSLVPLWNSANWLEREAFDMFGIIFEGHPNLRRMLLPDDWEEGYPLRKDYPLRGWREFPVYNQERTIGRVRTRWTGRGPS